MTLYAQTNLELFKQLKSEGYSHEDLLLIQKCYQLAMNQFTGMYRPSGKVAIAHFVGTASILASLKAPISLIAAGLLHAIYDHGDFGTLNKGVSNFKRNKVRQIVGQEVEEYLYRYIKTRADLATLTTFNQQLDQFDSIDRNTLLIRLVNELEDCLDEGILYCYHAKYRKSHYQKTIPLIIEMAEKLGFPTLARELQEALDQINLSKIPQQELRYQETSADFQVIPQSCLIKPHIWFYQVIIKQFNTFKIIRNKIKNKIASFLHRHQTSKTLN